MLACGRRIRLLRPCWRCRPQRAPHPATPTRCSDPAGCSRRPSRRASRRTSSTWSISMRQGRPIMAWTVDSGAVFDDDDLTLAVARLTPAGAARSDLQPGRPDPGHHERELLSGRPGFERDRRGASRRAGRPDRCRERHRPEGFTPRLGIVRLTAAGRVRHELQRRWPARRSRRWARIRRCPRARRRLGRQTCRSPGSGYEGCSLCDFFHRIPFVARFTAAGALDSTWDGDGHASRSGRSTARCSGWSSPPVATCWPPAAIGFDAFAVKLGDRPGAPCRRSLGDGVARTRFGASGSTGCGSSGLAFGVADGGAGRVLADRPGDSHGLHGALRGGPLPR